MSTSNEHTKERKSYLKGIIMTPRFGSSNVKKDYMRSQVVSSTVHTLFSFFLFLSLSLSLSLSLPHEKLKLTSKPLKKLLKIDLL